MYQVLVDSVESVERVMDDDPIDAATAISGSGPAYVFAFVQTREQEWTHIGLGPEPA